MKEPVTLYPVGTEVRTTWNNYQRGTIVGYGVISWPTGPNVSGDDGEMHPVYLVQIAEGSGYERTACLVFRADRIEAV